MIRSENQKNSLTGKSFPFSRRESAGTWFVTCSELQSPFHRARWLQWTQDGVCKGYSNLLAVSL